MTMTLAVLDEILENILFNVSHEQLRPYPSPPSTQQQSVGNKLEFMLSWGGGGVRVSAQLLRH